MTEIGTPPPNLQAVIDKAKAAIARAQAEVSDEAAKLADDQQIEAKRTSSEYIVVRAETITLPPEVENQATVQKIEATVEAIRADIVRLQTEQGVVEIRIPPDIKLTPETPITLEIPPNTRVGNAVSVYLEPPVQVPLPPQIQSTYPPVKQGDILIATVTPPTTEAIKAEITVPPKNVYANSDKINFPPAPKLSTATIQTVQETGVISAAQNAPPVVSENALTQSRPAAVTQNTQAARPQISSQTHFTAQIDVQILNNALQAITQNVEAKPQTQEAIKALSTIATASVQPVPAFFKITVIELPPSLRGALPMEQNLSPTKTLITSTNPEYNSAKNTPLETILNKTLGNTIGTNVSKALATTLKQTVNKIIPKGIQKGSPSQNAPTPTSTSTSTSTSTPTPTAPRNAPTQSVNIPTIPPINVTVIGHTQNGQTIINVPHIGLAHIQTPVFVPVGEILSVNATPLPLEILQTTPDLLAKLPDQLATQVTTGTYSRASVEGLLPAPLLNPAFAETWPALQESLNALAQASPNVARNMQNTLPAPSPRMVSTTMFFIAALRMGNLDAWLGDKNLDALKHTGKSGLLERLTGDFGRIASQANETLSGQWKAITIPLLYEGQISNIQLFVRGDEGQESDTEQDDQISKTRFVLNLSLSKMGALQLDGYLTPKTLDIILRTDHRLQSDIRQNILSAFSNALELTNLKGGLSFQSKKSDFISINTAPSDQNLYI